MGKEICEDGWDRYVTESQHLWQQGFAEPARGERPVQRAKQCAPYSSICHNARTLAGSGLTSANVVEYHRSKQASRARREVPG